MSFLLKRKNFFLFLFLFLLFSTNSKTALGQFTAPAPLQGAEDVLPGLQQPVTTNQTTSGARPSITDNFSSAIGDRGGSGGELSEADLVLKSKVKEDQEASPGTWVMRFVEGLSAAALPFFALGAIPIGFLFFSLSSLVLGIAAFGIDLALQIGVNLMSTIVLPPSNPVKASWEIFRNIANVGIIFTILFIAIKTILRSSGYDGKVLLGRVIIAALLINFSFLFGAIVVDVSNEMSLEIYKKVAKVTNGGQDSDRAELGSFMFEKASPSFFQSAIAKDTDPNTEEFFNKSFEGQGQGNSFTNALRSAALWTTNLSLGFIMGTVANLVLAAVLFMAIFTIYARVIVILILLVVSPIAFAAMILPNTQKISKEWWESLIGQSFFLPAFLLFILVGLKIVEKLPEQEGVVTSASQLQLTSLASYAAIFTPHVFKYIMVIGLFVAALMAAKKVQSMGSAAVGKISTSITNATGGAVSSAGAFIGRNTVGAGASALSKNEKVQDFLRKMPPIIGGTLGKNLEGIAKNSFDARNSSAFKGVASATGIGKDFSDTMKPQKDGFKGQSDRLSKRITETYSAIPDKKIDDNDQVKIKLDQAEKNVEANKELLKEAAKNLAQKKISQQQYDQTKKDTDKAIEDHKADQAAYREAQNPSKQKFISQKNAPVSIKNVWFASPINAAREVIKKESNLSDAEKLHKETMKALNDIKNAGK
jgi:hypothetical protein